MAHKIKVKVQQNGMGRVEIDGVELSDSIRKITITANPNQACTEVAVVFTGDVELDGEIKRLFADEPE